MKCFDPGQNFWQEGLITAIESDADENIKVHGGMLQVSLQVHKKLMPFSDILCRHPLLKPLSREQQAEMAKDQTQYDSPAGKASSSGPLKVLQPPGPSRQEVKQQEKEKMLTKSRSGAQQRLPKHASKKSV